MLHQERSVENEMTLAWALYYWDWIGELLTLAQKSSITLTKNRKVVLNIKEKHITEK